MKNTARKKKLKEVEPVAQLTLADLIRADLREFVIVAGTAAIGAVLEHERTQLVGPRYAHCPGVRRTCTGSIATASRRGVAQRFNVPAGTSIARDSSHHHSPRSRCLTTHVVISPRTLARGTARLLPEVTQGLLERPRASRPEVRGTELGESELGLDVGLGMDEILRAVEPEVLGSDEAIVAVGTQRLVLCTPNLVERLVNVADVVEAVEHDLVFGIVDDGAELQDGTAPTCPSRSPRRQKDR